MLSCYVWGALPTVVLTCAYMRSSFAIRSAVSPSDPPPCFRLMLKCGTSYLQLHCRQATATLMDSACLLQIAWLRLAPTSLCEIEPSFARYILRAAAQQHVCTVAQSTQAALSGGSTAKQTSRCQLLLAAVDPILCNS